MRLNAEKRAEIERLLRQKCFERTDLTDDQKNKLWAVLEKNQDIYVLDMDDIIPADLPPHVIDVQGAKPYASPHRRCHPDQRAEFERQADIMIKNNLMREAEATEWAFPAVLVNKKDGSKRFVVDYRKLNEVTRRDIYSPGNIEDAIDLLGQKRWFSACDLASSYFQTPMSPESIPYTTVRLPSGRLLQYLVLSFGLTNAPATFSRAMDSVFYDLKWRCMFPYLDDILVFSVTFEEHLEHLQQVFQRARERGLQFRTKKCDFASQKIRYLGYIVTAGKGISPDPENIDKIKRFPVPRTKKQCRSWCGLCSYYRVFVPFFSDLMDPVLEVSRPSSQFKWGPEQQKSFELMRQKLMSAPILALPDFSREFYLQCDASNVALGAVLSQFDDSNREHPVSYISRKLTPTEQKYAIREKEALAIVWGVRRLRPYLITKPFTIFTDHKSLEFLRHQEKSPRLARYHLMLQAYNFVIRWRPGSTKHQNADTMSRVVYDGYLKRDEPNEDTIDIFSITALSLPSREELKLAQEHDNLLGQILSHLKGKTELSSEVRDIFSGVGHYDIAPDSGLLRITIRNKPPRVVVPFALRNVIIRASHSIPSTGHLGVTKTLERIRRSFYWFKMAEDVASFVRGCLTCQKRKPSEPKRHGKLMLFPTDGPFVMVALDIVGPFPVSEEGYVAVAVWVCKFTRWVILSPIKSYTAKEISRVLIRDVIADHSCPRMIYCDLGKNFVSRVFRETSAAMGITNLYSTAFHHATQGNAERLNFTIKNIIFAFVDEGHRNWPDLLPSISMAYRTSVIEGLNVSAFELVFGRPPTLPLQLLYGDPTKYPSDPNEYHSDLLSTFRRIYRNTRDAQAKIDIRKARYYNRAQIPVEFEIGSLCLLWTPPTPKQGQTRQFLAKYTGPHKIIQKLNRLNYQIQDLKSKKKQTVHVQRMLKYHPHLISDPPLTSREEIKEEKSSTLDHTPETPPENKSAEPDQNSSLVVTPPPAPQVALPKSGDDGPDRFEFDLGDGKGKVIRKSIQNGTAKYLVNVDGCVDWVQLDPRQSRAYDAAYRKFRRNRRHASQ